MLEGKEKTAGKFSRVKFSRFFTYMRFGGESSFEALSWASGPMWTRNTSTVDVGPRRSRSEAVRTLPNTAVDAKHQVYVFARERGSLESRLLFTFPLRNMEFSMVPKSLLKAGWRFAAIAIPGVLSMEGIRKIEQRHEHVLRYAAIGENQKIADARGLELVFPFTVARTLMRMARDHKKSIAGLSLGHGVDAIASKNPAALEESSAVAYHEYRLAETVQTLLSDSDLGRDLGDSFSQSAPTETARLVYPRRLKIAQHACAAEAIAAECVAWCDTELFNILLEDAVVGKPGTHDVLDELRDIVEFFGETSAGIARLAAYAQGKRPDSFIHKGFVAIPDAGTPVFKRLRHSLKASANLFTAIYKADAILGHSTVQSFRSQLETWFSAVFAKSPWKLNAQVGSTKFFQGGVIGRAKKTFTRVKVEYSRLKPGQDVVGDLKRSVGTDATGFIADLSHVILAIETFNLGLSIHAVLKAAAHDTDKLLDSQLTASVFFLSLVGRALAEEIKGLGPGASRAAATTVTNLGGFYFAYKNIGAAQAAGDVGDSDAQAAMVIAAGTELGGVMLAIAAAFAADGSMVAVVAGPVGAVLGMIGGLCYLVYEVVKDGELALAIQYSKYGSMAEDKLPDPEFVPWCPVSPSAMRDSAQASLLGIEYGLRQFTLTTGERPETQSLKTIFLPRIVVGHVDAETSFEVEWDILVSINGKPTKLKKTEFWTPFGDQSPSPGNQRAYAGKLKMEKETGEMFFDAELAEGFSVFGHPSFEGFVRVRKHFRSLGQAHVVPLQRSVDLLIFTTMTTHGSRRIRSSSVKP